MNKVVCIGNFATLHIGHQKLIQKVLNEPDESLEKCIIFINIKQKESFWTDDEKDEIIKEMGDLSIIHLELETIKNYSPLEFIDYLKSINVTKIIIGDDFKFGQDRLGDVNLLKQYFEVESEAIVAYEGIKVSSSNIIKDIKGGDLIHLEHLLNRHYFITGEVFQDKQLARTLNYPTANQKLDGKIKPKFGVYVSKITIPGSEVTFYGMTNIGDRPTTNNDHVVVCETNIFDFNNDIYGYNIKVELLAYLRQEMKFNSLEHLIEAIKNDEKEAKKIIGEKYEQIR